MAFLKSKYQQLKTLLQDTEGVKKVLILLLIFGLIAGFFIMVILGFVFLYFLSGFIH